MTSNEMKFSFQMKFDSLFDFSAPEYDDRHVSYILTEAQHRVFIKRYNPMADKYQKGFEGDEQRRRDLEQLIRSAKISGNGFTGELANQLSGYGGQYTLGVGTTIGLVPGLPLELPGKLSDGTLITAIVDSQSVRINKPALDDILPTPIWTGIGKSRAQGDVHPNGIFLDLPDGFLYAIEEGVKLSNVAKEAWVKPVKHDEYLANINNPYKKPYKNIVWRMDVAREVFAEGSISSTNKRTELILPDTYTVEYYRVRYLAMPPAIVCNEFDESEQVHCILDETLHREIVDEAVAIAQAAVKKEDYQIGINEQQRSQ